MKKGHLFRAPGNRAAVVTCDGEEGIHGVLRPLSAPLPPGYGLAHVHPCADGHVEYEVVHEPSGPTDHAGPAQVATTAYRDGWDRIFGEGVTGDRSVN